MRGGRRRNFRGKAFESELMSSFKHWNEVGGRTHLFKMRISDTQDFIKINPLIMIPKQPGDFFLVYKGRAILIEAKSTIMPSFRTEWLRDGQREGLTSIEKASGEGYIFFSNRGSPNRTWAVRWPPIEPYFSDVSITTISFSQVISRIGVELPRELVKVNGRIKSIWNLTPILEG